MSLLAGPAAVAEVAPQPVPALGQGPGGTAGCSAGEGPEFVFASADPVLRQYGYVLWRAVPSPAAAPLDYQRFVGRRGRLTGTVLHRYGRRWLEAIMASCQRVYAEDASTHSPYAPVRHLELYGRVYFTAALDTARSLRSRDIVVRGDGLLPRQRLYTGEREVWYALHGGQRLRVVGVDTHRYAHAKGAGPFFLEVENGQGQRGLIKYNPQYFRLSEDSVPRDAQIAEVASR